MITNKTKHTKTDTENNKNKRVRFNIETKNALLSPKEEKSAYDAGYNFGKKFPNATAEVINISAKRYSDTIILEKELEISEKMIQAGKDFAKNNPNATDEEINKNFDKILQSFKRK